MNYRYNGMNVSREIFVSLGKGFKRRRKETIKKYEDGEPLSCRSPDGITVGLIDALISISRILANRNISGDHPAVKDALDDLISDEDFNAILNAARKGSVQ